MAQIVWKLEESGGFLIRDRVNARKSSYFHLWAGLVFGPFRSLEEFAEGALLDECRAVMTTAGMPIKPEAEAIA